MNRPWAAALLILSMGRLAESHRLDEYLQAALISLEKGRVNVELRLTPGVAILPVFLAMTDRDGDGVISEPEQSAYAGRVLREITLTCDGQAVALRVAGGRFPPAGELKEGMGAIELEFEGNLPGAAARRSLTFENHHLPAISAYLVNSLVPHDPEIRITAQHRNPSQSVYRMEYEVDGAPANRGAWAFLGLVGSLLLARLAFSKAGPIFAARERLGPSS